MSTNRDRLLSLTSKELSLFLFEVAEIGNQFFMDQVCDVCTDPDCPTENGCRYTPQGLIQKWLKMEQR